jgi:hypothetical protein
MQIERPQTARRRRRDALGTAALVAAAELDWLVRTRAGRLSRPAKIGVGLLTATVAAIAYLRGADVRAGLAGGQANLLPNVLAGEARDGRAPGQ